LGLKWPSKVRVCAWLSRPFCLIGKGFSPEKFPMCLYDSKTEIPISSCFIAQFSGATCLSYKSTKRASDILPQIQLVV
jgi:hypothetical protein